jgi:hypothetical protein
VRLSPFGTAAVVQPTVPAPDDSGAIGGMPIDRRDRSTRRKPAPEALRQPQTPHDQIRARTRAAAVGSR